MYSNVSRNGGPLVRVFQGDRQRANDETAEREKELEERQRDIDALHVKVGFFSGKGVSGERPEVYFAFDPMSSTSDGTLMFSCGLVRIPRSSTRDRSQCQNEYLVFPQTEIP